MPIRTKRWNDPVEDTDGHRVLICRYRPRGVRREDEAWDAWCKDLAPSVELHADYYGKRGEPISIAEYKRRFLAEMRGQRAVIERFAERTRAGETITLLCSSACVDPSKCHRTIIRDLIERAASR
ncbi:DUF488 family protein [Sorangium sp. So ce260]|uniref:DUF488 domain-containing protein n=1 Tax=Sorangium sp. So ce260 TaxID=3133291 RepID=UPI003F60878B